MSETSALPNTGVIEDIHWTARPEFLRRQARAGFLDRQTHKIPQKPTSSHFLNLWVIVGKCGFLWVSIGFCGFAYIWNLFYMQTPDFPAPADSQLKQQSTLKYDKGRVSWAGQESIYQMACNHNAVSDEPELERMPTEKHHYHGIDLSPIRILKGQRLACLQGLAFTGDPKKHIKTQNLFTFLCVGYFWVYLGSIGYFWVFWGRAHSAANIHSFLL